MTADETKPRSSLAVWLVVVLLLLPVGYVLSIGPAVWLIKHGYLNKQVSQTFYGPLIFVASLWGPMMRLLQWYAELWRG
jgi:hypothetical protein